MESIISPLIKQWPVMTLLLALGFAFWKMFERHLDEYKNLMEQKDHVFNSISEQREKDYARNSQERQKEIEGLRIQVLALLDDIKRKHEDGVQKQKQFDELKDNFSKMSLENLALKRLIERLEEMMRATGGDVKVISTQLRKTQEDLETVSSQIQRIEYKSN